jgi:predicted DNA-binding transcriptional regulator YafY
MPQTKKALIRYKILDDLLSDSHHYYSTKDIWEQCCRKLLDCGFEEVTLRCIQEDLKFLDSVPFCVRIERFRKNGNLYVRYSQKGFSIFKKKLSDEEKSLLREVLATLGQFEGLDNFTWLDDFKKELGVGDRRQIMWFSHNPYLRNSNLLGTLFDDIANQVVVRLSYHTFTNPNTRSIDFHPYLLKQYNDRWFVFGAADSDRKILTFALDRIDKVEPLPEKKYIPCPDDLNDRFEDIIGVTFYEDRPVEHIVFWVSDVAKGYVVTKPLHPSQILFKGEKDEQLRKEYPTLTGGHFFSIDCISNYELVRALCSYGQDLIVLQSDGKVLDEVYQRIAAMKEDYDRLRSSRSH